MRTSTKLEIVITTIVGMMILGTLAYHALEKWNYVDSFYFTGVTLTTIGYGDLHPTTDLSKIFTVFFSFGGVGILAASLSVVAGAYFDRREKTLSKSLHRRLINSVKKSGKGHKKRVRDLIEGSEI